jgi:hypothetical protein
VKTLQNQVAGITPVGAILMQLTSMATPAELLTFHFATSRQESKRLARQRAIMSEAHNSEQCTRGDADLTHWVVQGP